MAQASTEDNDVMIIDEPDGSESYFGENLLTSISEANRYALEQANSFRMKVQEIEEQKLDVDITDVLCENISSLLLDKTSTDIVIPTSVEDLDRMIKKIAEEFANEFFKPSAKEEKEFDETIEELERSHQAISKMFLDSHKKMVIFRKSLLKEAEAVQQEIRQHNAKLSQETLLVDSEEEDDSERVVYPSSSSQNVSQIPGTAGSSIMYQTNQVPSLAALRSHFVNTVNKEMPNLIQSLGSQAQPNEQMNQQFQLPQQQASKIIKWPELTVNSKVLGKKFNDVWYPGTILDVYESPKGKPMDWSCKVKFDGKGMKVLPGKHVAYREPINVFVKVGTRVVAVYREDNKPNSLYAGVVAESPSTKNSKRFLIFFDDGYAQYCDAKEIYKVYMQSEHVWEDIHPDTSDFIKEYLRVYPERPLVRLSVGKVVKTEWNGKWWIARVHEVDASLVKMYFQADQRTEWIYRGSTRLEPLHKALSNADAIKAAGSSRGRRLNLSMRPSDPNETPSVEYTRGTTSRDPPRSEYKEPTQAKSSNAPQIQKVKNKNTARKSTGGGNYAIKSTGGWKAPWLKYQRKASATEKKSKPPQTPPQAPPPKKSTVSTKEKLSGGKASSKSSKDMATLLQERLSTSTSNDYEYDHEKTTGERKDFMIDAKNKETKKYTPHSCSFMCIKDTEVNPDKFKGRSPLLVPLLMGWCRHVGKARPTHKRFVVYQAPCGRRLRSIDEVDRYLMITDSALTIDLFCYDHQLHVNSEFVPVKTFCDIKDLSYGRENYPVSCVNGVNREYPDYLEYRTHRIPAKDVHINTDTGFMACCDCTDNCRNKKKCACQQLTIENTTCIGPKDNSAGYVYRRLREPLFTGIVECNSQCKCDKRCLNRVAQHGLKQRLQVFKTAKKGWGLRCLDDIAKGSFICIYAGQLLTDKGANEDGKQYGDEYLAELDFIEVVEGQKEGYESDVDMDVSDNEDSPQLDKRKKKEDEDSDYVQEGPLPENLTNRRSRSRRVKSKDEEEATENDEKKKDKVEDKKTGEDADQPISISDDEEVEQEAPTKSPIEDPYKRRRAKKSTGGSRFNLSTSLNIPAPVKEEIKETKHKSTRSFFRDETECYIMDAKSMGNLGRYLNHSCNPNVFVQNIFVDTHDLRFPWVAFFAMQYIRAGTELTWDYNYEVDSVPDKVLYCYCNTSTCRGRLL